MPRRATYRPAGWTIMIGLVAPVAVAGALGIALGGSLDGCTVQRIRWWVLALLALGVQIPLYSPPFSGWPAVVASAPLLSVGTMFLVLLVVLRNAVGRTRPACLLAGLGIAMNLTVMVANGGLMPRADDLAPAPINRPVGPDGEVQVASNTAPMTATTHLLWLADTIAEPAWLPMANLVSPGDLALALGAAAWVLLASTRRTPVIRPEYAS